MHVSCFAFIQRVKPGLQYDADDAHDAIQDAGKDASKDALAGIILYVMS